MQREKRTLSGPLLEVDFYPVYTDGRKKPTRAPKSKPTREEQKRYNRAMTAKKIVRLVNANFDSTDYWMHPTYAAALAPQTEEEAHRDMYNYIRRVKTKRRSELKKFRRELEQAEEAAAAMPENDFLSHAVEDLKARVEKLEQPLKVLYEIEEQVYKTGRYAGRVNWHFHVFITGGIESKDHEKMWKHGVRVNCNRYQPDRFGPEAAASYMGKGDAKGQRRLCYSKNLKKPDEKIRDDKISRRAVEKIATQRVDDAAYWESRYRGYRFLRCYSRFNEYNQSWYVSAVMYKSDAGPPAWQGDDWFTTFY